MAKTLQDLVAEARGRITEVTAKVLAEKLERGDDLLLVDIREPGEWDAGRLPGAVLIPRGTLESAADLTYPKRHPLLSAARDRPVVMYCASGGRSAFGAERLGEMGFTDVSSLEGGIGAWVEDGHAVTTG